MGARKTEVSPDTFGVVGSSFSVRSAHIPDTVRNDEVVSSGMILPRIPFRKMQPPPSVMSGVGDLGTLAISRDNSRVEATGRHAKHAPSNVPVRPPPSRLPHPRRQVARRPTGPETGGVVAPTFEVLGHGVSGDSFPGMMVRRGSSAPPGRS
jgi:hypothetical protein